VTIRLLSGEVIRMETDRALPVAGWADQFVVQQGYQPSATARLVFLLQGNEEEKEENIVFWSPEERHHGQSIGDVLGDREPLLHLLIRSAGEEEQKEKAPLLRKILQTLHRDDSLSDKELYEMYANWRLTRDVSALGNRYQKMVAFVEAHPEDFPLLGEEEQARQTRRADLAAFRAFRSWAIPRRPEPDRKQAIRMRIAHTFQRHGQENANFNKIDMCRILCSLTVEEFFQTGAQIHNVRETFKGRRFLAEWERYCREADAENHEDA
jgi:hypothetical protein